MAKSKTEKLIRKILKDENKSGMYSQEEITYFNLQLKLLKLERRKKKVMTKYTKGFTPIKNYEANNSKGFDSERSETPGC